MHVSSYLWSERINLQEQAEPRGRMIVRQKPPLPPVGSGPVFNDDGVVVHPSNLHKSLTDVSRYPRLPVPRRSRTNAVLSLDLMLFYYWFQTKPDVVLRTTLWRYLVLGKTPCIGRRRGYGHISMMASHTAESRASVFSSPEVSFELRS